jgi:hypothetical protein
MYTALGIEKPYQIYDPGADFLAKLKLAEELS